MWNPWCGRDPITIEWSGIDFASRYELDRYPRWVLRETDWWNGSAEDPDTVRAPRGVWTGTQHFASRTVSWSGMLQCTDRDMLLEEMRALQSGRGTSLRVWEAEEGRQATCRKSQTLITPISDRYATYSVTVVLDDPLVSSIDEAPLGPVTNAGAVRARPVVSVTAPGARPTVSIGSWSIQAPRTLSGGEVFRVDCRTETLYIDGSAVFPVLAEFPTITPGATATIATSHGTGTVDGVSAWI